jgi:hypothetical protein
MTQTAHFTAPNFFDRIIEVLDDVDPVEQDLCLRGVRFDQIGVGRLHVHADDAQRMAAPCTHFFGEERSDCLLGPVVTHPQQNPPLQIVNHRQIDLPLPSASSMPMTLTGGRARWRKPYATARFTMVATLFQFNPYWRAVPCQLNSRASLATAFDSAVVTRAQGSAHGKVLHPQPTPGAFDSTGAVAQFQWQFPHRQIAPFPRLAHTVHLATSLPGRPRIAAVDAPVVRCGRS